MSSLITNIIVVSFLHCSAYNQDRMDKNPCILGATQKHGVDSAESLETLTKRGEKALLKGNDSWRQEIGREVEKKPISLRILTKN